ncbi:MAG: beta-propeller fold lactonase family protein [Planctomycetota bacterium]|nr:beta-propeller fold lactonase family protein [Planctomycetota bacterium]
METNHRRLGSALVLSCLAACGGSGGGGTAPTPITAPSNLVYSGSNALVMSGIEIAPLLPTFDGDVDLFEVSPSLPTGLVLDPVTGVLAGLPTVPVQRRDYTITARNAGGSTTSGVRLEIAAPQRFALVTNGADDSLATLAVDTRAARLLRGPLSFSGSTDVGAESPVTHPSGRFVYVPHATSNSLVAWRIDAASGAAERIASRVLDNGPHAAAIDPSGSWLAVSCRGSDDVFVFAIDPGTGMPSLVHTVPVGTQPSDLGFSRDGRQLFVTHAGLEITGLGSSLACYAFQPLTGTMALQSAPLGLNGGRPTALVIDPNEPLVYLAVSEFDGVLAVRTSTTGAMTPFPPLRASGDDPVDIELDATGETLFVAAAADDEIRSFQTDPATGTLSEVGSFAAGVEPRTLKRDALGNRLYAVARGSSELITFLVGPDGTLTRESSLALRPGSSGIAFATGSAQLEWTPRFVHCANAGSDDVHSFRVDEDTGALTFTGQTFTDDGPSSLALDPRMRFAIVSAEAGRTVQSFAVSSTTGVLSAAAPSVAITGTPTHVVVESSGRFAYVTVRDAIVPGDGWILTFGLDATSGALTLLDARAAGLGSCAVEVEPTGEFLYVANSGNGTPGSASIAAFRIDPLTGIPSSVGGPVSAPGVAELAFHPDGRVVYAVLRGSDALARYTIDRESGVLTVVPPVAATGLEPASLVVDPRARFAWASYTANAAAGKIEVLTVLEGGQLGPVQQQIVDGNDPIALALEPSGRFLYAANQGSHDISILAVDPLNGNLVPRAPMPAGTAPTAIVATGTTY